MPPDPPPGVLYVIAIIGILIALALPVVAAIRDLPDDATAFQSVGIVVLRLGVESAKLIGVLAVLSGILFAGGCLIERAGTFRPGNRVAVIDGEFAGSAGQVAAAHNPRHIDRVLVTFVIDGAERTEQLSPREVLKRGFASRLF